MSLEQRGRVSGLGLDIAQLRQSTVTYELVRGIRGTRRRRLPNNVRFYKEVASLLEERAGGSVEKLIGVFGQFVDEYVPKIELTRGESRIKNPTSTVLARELPLIVCEFDAFALLNRDFSSVINRSVDFLYSALDMTPETVDRLLPFLYPVQASGSPGQIWEAAQRLKITRQ